MDQRLLLVHAHPDDETIGQGATMASYVARGTQVTLVTCTLGEEGEVLVPELEHIAADGVRAAVAQGDEKMRNLVLMGEPARNEHALGELLDRIDDIERELP